MGFFVPTANLQQLKNYKYQSEDRSLTTKYVLKPFWLKFAKIFPIWMAPNVVTLLGFSFMIVNVMTTLFFDPTLTEGSPRWAYFSYALGLFMYQTFDACDGIHARRTGQSGPLGELFDHCIDSLNTTLSIIPVCSATRSGYTPIMILTQFAVLGNFYLSTWEEYHTGKLFLSEFSGPVEGILSVIVSFVICGVIGADVFWHYKIIDFIVAEIEIEVTILHLLFISSVIGILFNIYSARRNVAEYYKQNSSDAKDYDEKVANSTEGLIPFAVYYFSIFLTILVEPLFVSLPFILSIGLTMAFVVGRIIIGHLTKQPFPMINFPMFLPTFQMFAYMFATTLLGRSTETTVHAIVWSGLGLSLGIHAMFINEIIYDFTQFLDVYALSIKHPKTA